MKKTMRTNKIIETLKMAIGQEKRHIWVGERSYYTK